MPKLRDGSSRWIEAEMGAKGLPALSIALIDDQKIVWVRGFRVCRPRAAVVPATSETVYRVGSVSKLFTDIAVMQLVDRGEARSLCLSLRYPQSPSSCARNLFSRRPITLRQPSWCTARAWWREPPVGHYFDPAPPCHRRRQKKPLRHDLLVFEPGTQTKYSNAGIAVVGAVVEHLSGEPFARGQSNCVALVARSACRDHVRSRMLF